MKVELGTLKDKGEEVAAFLEPRVGTKPSVSADSLEIEDGSVRQGVKPRHVKTYIKRYLYMNKLREKYRVFVAGKELTVQEIVLGDEKEKEKEKAAKEEKAQKKAQAEKPAKEPEEEPEPEQAGAPTGGAGGAAAAAEGEEAKSSKAEKQKPSKKTKPKKKKTDKSEDDSKSES